MKTSILFTLIVLLSAALHSQSRVPLNHPRQNVPVTAEFKQILGNENLLAKPVNTTVTSYRSSLGFEEHIGSTLYDLQTNNSLSDRIHIFEDGTVGAVWTMGLQSAPSFPDRGTGYNYFDGTTWGTEPTTRVETIRAGWPSYAPLGSNGELIISHDFGAGTAGLLVNKRSNKGTGNWEETLLLGPAGQTNIVWPRMTTSGFERNSVHLVALTRPTGNGGTPYQGQDGALLYSRSTDAGQSWDIQNIVLPGLGADSYTFFSADEYVWAKSRAGTLALVVGSKWYDLVLMKSTDNGDTWTKTVIWQHPYPMWDWNTTLVNDTLWTVDGSFSVALDGNGMAHVVWGLTRVGHTEAGTSYSYWPYSDGIGYWNESMGSLPPHPTNPHKTLDPDFLYANGNLVGWSQDVNGNGQLDIFDLEILPYRTLGISSMPAIVISEYNVIGLIYSSITEGFDDGTYYYKKLWARLSPDNGTTWGEFVHLTSDLLHMFDECIYAQIASYNPSFNELCYSYQADETPGLALDDEHPYQQNFIYFNGEPGIGTGMVRNQRGNLYTISQNYPNPAGSFTKIKVDLFKPQHLQLKITTITGQQMEVIDKGLANEGTHVFHIHTENYLPGMYFYTVVVDGESSTHKMVVR